MVLSSSLFNLDPPFHTSCSRWAEQPYQVQVHPPPCWGPQQAQWVLQCISEVVCLCKYSFYWKADTVLGYSITDSSMDSGKNYVLKKITEIIHNCRESNRLDLRVALNTATCWNNQNAFNITWRWFLRPCLCFSTWQFHLCVWQWQVCKHAVHSSVFVFL